ncbi:MAG: DUF2202 domain-containing protein [Prolixibacteraceae bacterium]
MKTFIITSVLMVVALFFTSCNNEIAGIDAASLEKSTILSDSICTDSIFTTTIDDLSEADIAGLMLMREEEKMAHDVYVYFFEKYELTIFDRISNSETKHAESVLALLNHFELADPALTESGVFASEELQALYDQLIEMGDASVEAALNVGGLIEETDILDLQNLLDATENADITTVYSHLLRGSNQHLKAFSRTLLSYDITYVPTILTQEAYDAILATPNGQGNQGNAMRNGNGNKGAKGNKGVNGGQGKGGNGGNGGNGGQGQGSGSGDGTGTCVVG